MSGRAPFYQTIIGRILVCGALVMIGLSWFSDDSVSSLAYIGAMTVILYAALSYGTVQAPLARPQARRQALRAVLAVAVGFLTFVAVATALQALHAPAAVGAVGATLVGIIPAIVILRSGTRSA